MRRFRSILTRLTPLFWVAAVTLAVLRLTDPRLPHAFGSLVVLATGAGLTGTTIGAVQATHDHALDMLIDALLTTRGGGDPCDAAPTEEELRRRLRGVA